MGTLDAAAAPGSPGRGPGMILWVVGTAVFLAGMAWISAYSYLLFHGLVEVFSIAVAWSMFFLAWNTRRNMDNDYLLFLGVAYLFIGSMDLLHTLAYKGMNTFPGYGSNLAIELWIASRYVEASALVLAPFMVRKGIHAERVFAGFAAVTALLLALVFTGHFPDCFVDGVGLTPFKKISEYVIGAMLVLAGWLLWRRRDQFEPKVLRLLMAAIACTVAGEFVFTLYVTLFSLPNIVGHFLKLASFFLIYKALIETGLSQPFAVLFRNLKQAEEEARRNEEILNSAGEMARVGGWQVDVDKGEVIWSREVYRIHGVDQDFEITMESALSFFHPEDRPRLEQALERAVRLGEPYDLELRFHPATGGELWVRSICRVEMRGGRPVRLSGVFQDITEAKRAETLREDVDRIMRHDLRTPLAGFINFPQLILDQEQVSEDSAGMLRLMEESGRRMLRMLDISRDLFKMESGRYEPEPEPVDMLAVCRHVASEHGPILRARDLRLDVLVDGRPPADGERFEVLGEDVLLHTMLSNLVHNALEASPRGGAVRVGMRRDAGAVEVRVHNQGTVPERVRPVFFEKYATHGKRHGTGLGTYSARLIARTLNGEVEMATSETGGTTVTVTLPAA